MVRQHRIQFLLQEKKYPVSLVNVEKSIQVYGQWNAADIIVTLNGRVKILVECSSHTSPRPSSFWSTAAHNLLVDSEFLMLNG